MYLQLLASAHNRKILYMSVLTALLLRFPALPCYAQTKITAAPDATGVYAANLLAGSALNLDGLHSRSIILLARHSLQILSEKNAGRPVYPASLTKIMTAVVVTDKLTDLDARIAVPGDFFEFLEQSHASVAGFKPGESISVRDLLYGVLLPSGADASLTLARQTAGSEEAFVDLMNAKALALGMTSTHFMNPTGLHHPLQYTTAADMAKLLDYALNRPVLRQMLTTKYYRTAATPEHPQGLFLKERLFFLLREQARLRNKPELDSGALSPTTQILGGKTGATSDAGLCLASFATIHGREYILVTTAAMGDIFVDRFHVTDALQIYGQLDQLLGKT